MCCGKCYLWDFSGCFKGLVPVPAWTPVPKHKVCAVPTVPLPFAILEGFPLARLWRLGELINRAVAVLTPRPPAAISSQGLDWAKGSEEPAVLSPVEIPETSRIRRPCAGSSHSVEFHPHTSQVRLTSGYPPAAIPARGAALEGVALRESSRKWCLLPYSMGDAPAALKCQKGLHS